MKGGKSALLETLKRQILTLELQPGHDLDEVQLSTEYGISCTPVRDVLRRLSGEGFVEIRENRGARVIPMNHATLRDFFLVAPLIYEAVGRLAVQNFHAVQLAELQACQQRFRVATAAGEPEAMVVENCMFHGSVGAMAHSAFLQSSLNKLLIDHARIGHTFFRPRDNGMRANLKVAAQHHDAFIAAIGERDEPGVVRLVHAHWESSRSDMEMFIAPNGPISDAMRRLSPAPAARPRHGEEHPCGNDGGGARNRNAVEATRRLRQTGAAEPASTGAARLARGQLGHPMAGISCRAASLSPALQGRTAAHRRPRNADGPVGRGALVRI